jgi:ATP-binding protein involved in chromosome partitioning
MNQIKNIIAVSSGKGGVGKSSIATNLALSLSNQKFSVGLLDADIYGPNIPKMLGVPNETKVSMINSKFKPLLSHNILINSMALMSTDNTPLIWRGPMAGKACIQLYKNTTWGDLDFLIIDFPPGTGDIQLTLGKNINFSGAVIVTTPQDISLLDVKKGIEMFKKLKIKCLGVIENMSGFSCSKCGNEENIFGKGAGNKIFSEYSIPLLGKIPLSVELCDSMDLGKPIAYHNPTSIISLNFSSISKNITREINS